MNEQEVREILKDDICPDVRLNGRSDFMIWNPGDGTITLDGG